MNDDLFRSTRLERIIDLCTMTVMLAVAFVVFAVILAAGWRLVLWVAP